MTVRRSVWMAVGAIWVLSVGAAAIQSKPPSRAKGSPAKAAAPAERRVPFAVGELLTYDVSWSNYLTAGTITLRTESKKPSFSSTAYYVTAEAQTTGVVARLYTLYYKADTLIDVFTLLPQRGSVYSREGRRERLKTTTFDQARHKAQFQMKTASLLNIDLDVAPLTQDILSAVYVLRSIQPRTGDRLDIPVSDSGKKYTVTFVVGNVESVEQADGTRVPALRVTPQVREHGTSRPIGGTVLWLANDTSLKPVRMESTLAVGRVVAALK
jgi:hypothetical protein